MPLVTPLMPSEASLLRGDVPCDMEDEVDGLLSFPENTELLDIVSRPSEASLLLGETPRGGIDELTTLLSFSAKSIFFTISLTLSEVGLLLGETPLDEAGILSFSGKSTLFIKSAMPPEVVLLGESPLDEDRLETGPINLSDDFVLVCDAALNTLDNDALGAMLGDETGEESVLLSFSVKSTLSDRVMVPSDAAVVIGDTLLDEIAEDESLRSLRTTAFLDTSSASLEGDFLGVLVLSDAAVVIGDTLLDEIAKDESLRSLRTTAFLDASSASLEGDFLGVLVPSDAAVVVGDTLLDEIAKEESLRSLRTTAFLDASSASLEGDFLGDPPCDDIDEETSRSILSARSILLDKVFAAEYIVVRLGETPRNGTDGTVDLLILSVRSMLLDIVLADTLPPIIAGQR
jgi:hypothetical protein